MKNCIFENMFNPDMILLDYEANSSIDFLEGIADLLFHKGYVKESFKKAILEREQLYPTGLPTVGVKVAMPHTDIKHALRPVIAVVKFEHPVIFKEMGNGINTVAAQLAFVLVVTELNGQVKTLQALMELFCKEKALERIYNCTDKETMLQMLLQELRT